MSTISQTRRDISIYFKRKENFEWNIVLFGLKKLRKNLQIFLSKDYQIILEEIYFFIFWLTSNRFSREIIPKFSDKLYNFEKNIVNFFDEISINFKKNFLEVSELNSINYMQI